MKIMPVIRIVILLGIIAGAGCGMEGEAQIDTLFAEYSGDVPGASVMVIREGKILFEKGYGLAYLEKKIPVTPETNFRLASVTKEFTAMCIMQLAAKNALSFESSLCDIFPDFPEYGRRVTVHHLLRHTSGLVDYESLIPEDAVRQVHDDDVLAMMAAQDSTYFPPGAEYRYSNSGYAVLAMVVERLSGQNFSEYLRGNIFEPTGMNRTIALVEGVNTVPDRAFGYVEKDGSVLPSDQSLTSAVLGDGGIYSSVRDLYKWDQALYSDRLVSREMIEKAFMPGELSDGSPTGYGYGWMIDEFGGRRRIFHTGETCGFSTTIQRFPEDRMTVIVLANRRDADVKTLAEKIAGMYF